MKRKKSRHHRKPRSLGGKTEPRNISVVDKRRHAHWHALFGNKPIEEIARELNEIWLDPDYEIVVYIIRKEPKRRHK